MANYPWRRCGAHGVTWTIRAGSGVVVGAANGHASLMDRIGTTVCRRKGICISENPGATNFPSISPPASCQIRLVVTAITVAADGRP
jgi:hypothetical protein